MIIIRKYKLIYLSTAKDNLRYSCTHRSEGLLEDSCRMIRLLHSATKQIINIIIIIIIIVIKIIIIPNIDYS